MVVAMRAGRGAGDQVYFSNFLIRYQIALLRFRCWERKGTATLGRAAVALGLWSADIIVSDQTRAAWWESCSSCPGNRTVAIKGS